MHRCLVVTNDFPPRQGGIETFVYELAARFPAERVVLYAALRFPVPRVARRACELARSYGCDRVWFRAGVPGARQLLRRIAGRVDASYRTLTRLLAGEAG